MVREPTYSENELESEIKVYPAFPVWTGLQSNWIVDEISYFLISCSSYQSLVCNLQGNKANTLATWREEMTHWKRPWYWERLKAGGEGMKEDEMVGWHHWFNGYESEQTQGDSKGQGSLACCSPYGVTKKQTWLSNFTRYPTLKHMKQTLVDKERNWQ